jgi:hypothetical protein
MPLLAPCLQYDITGSYVLCVVDDSIRAFETLRPAACGVRHTYGLVGFNLVEAAAFSALHVVCRLLFGVL